LAPPPSPPRGSRSQSRRPARGRDFYLATSGDLYLATSEDIFMTTDNLWTSGIRQERSPGPLSSYVIIRSTPDTLHHEEP
jgi:hypothetical protein